jgi:hypothetical protein
MTDTASFARLVTALRPWLGRIVVVGGWAHRLHRLHPLASPSAYPPLATLDADIALSDRGPLEGDIRAALREAGFHEAFFGDHSPPVIHYELGREDGGFFAEFLAPLRGDGRNADGSESVTLRIAGVSAQRLRHLELLLAHPWEVRLGPDSGIDLDRPADVPIANPVSFIAQKLLIHDLRPPSKRAQDALYIHDTLELFGGELDTLATVWRDGIRGTLHEKAARRVVALCESNFGRVTDTLREAARIPPNRRLRPERLQETCAFGLAQIFGASPPHG